MSNNGHNSTLTPELRSWIDNCVVPALVGEFLGRLEREKRLASSAEATVESAPARTAIAEEGR